jgi:hypothetical protein
LLPVCAHFKLLKQMKTRTTLLHLWTPWNHTMGCIYCSP